MFPRFLKEIEEKTGLPKLSDVASTLKNLPDEKTLRLVKSIIGDIGKVKGSQDELLMAVALIKFIAEADMEHLNAIKEITGNLVKLIRYLPKGMLSQLPVAEIAEEIQKRMKEE